MQRYATRFLFKTYNLFTHFTGTEKTAERLPEHVRHSNVNKNDNSTQPVIFFCMRTANTFIPDLMLLAAPVFFIAFKIFVHYELCRILNANDYA